jgi:hypothetical protein
MAMTRKLFYFLLGLLLLLYACSKKKDAASLNKVVCYEEDVAPLLQNYCAPCHIAHTAGNVALNAYVNAKMNIHSSVLAVKRDDKRMPKGRPPLTAEQIAILENWRDKGTKQCTD